MKNCRSVHTCSYLIPASMLVLALSTSTIASSPVATAPGQSTVLDNRVVKEPEKPLEFTLRGGVGYLTGESKELVYWPSADNHKASELTWKIDSLFMVGVGASLRTGRWFTINFDGWFKATNGDGTMDDYDWQVPGYPWTDWSHHEDTDVTDGSIIDFNGQISFYRTDTVILNGYIGYKRDNFGWESRGGNYTYSVGGFRDRSGSFTDGDLAISYEQTMEVPYLGFGIDVDLGRFKLDGRVIYSPLVQGESVDHHHMRNLVTYDDFSDGDMIAIDVAGVYEITPHLALEAGLNFQSYDTMKGDSEWHYNNTGEVVLLRNGAGMDQQSSMVSFSVLYTF